MLYFNHNQGSWLLKSTKIHFIQIFFSFAQKTQIIRRVVGILLNICMWSCFSSKISRKNTMRTKIPENIIFVRAFKRTRQRHTPPPPPALDSV